MHFKSALWHRMLQGFYFISTSEGQPAYLTRSFARSLPTRAEAHSTQAGEQGRFRDSNQSASVQWLPDKSTKTRQVWSQAWNSSHRVRVQLNAPCNVAQARTKSLNVAPTRKGRGETPGKAPHSSHTAHLIFLISRGGVSQIGECYTSIKECPVSKEMLFYRGLENNT